MDDGLAYIGLISAIYQHELSIGVHMPPPSWTSIPPPTLSHPSRLLQSPCLRSLSHTVNFYWLSILHWVILLCSEYKWCLYTLRLLGFSSYLLHYLNNFFRQGFIGPLLQHGEARTSNRLPCSLMGQSRVGGGGRREHELAAMLALYFCFKFFDLHVLVNFYVVKPI